MKAKKLFWALVATFAALSMTVAISSCEKKDKEDLVIDPTEDSTISEDQPSLEKPGAGKVTICVQAPAEMCGYLVAPGEISSWEPGNGEESGQALTLVEGKKLWYAGTFDWVAETNDAFKLAATDENGDWKWDYQLAKGQLLEGDCSEKMTEDIVINSDNQVIYIKIESFTQNPCKEANKAGTATFNLKATGFPEGTEFAIAGNFTDGAWAQEPTEEHILKLENGVYTGSFEVNEGFLYKYLVKLPEVGTWAWWTPDPNLAMPLDLVTNDTTEYVTDEPTE